MCAAGQGRTSLYPSSKEKDAPAFETCVPDLGDVPSVCTHLNAEGVESPDANQDGGTQSMGDRRVLGPCGAPLSNEDIVECLNDEGEVNLVLKRGRAMKEPNLLGNKGAASETDLITGNLEKSEIGVSEPYPDFEAQLREVLRKGDAMNVVQKPELEELLREYKHVFTADK